MKKLDKNEILQFITVFVAEHGYSPSGQEMGDNFGTTKAAISYQIKKMKELGMISYQPNIARSIQVLDSE